MPFARPTAGVHPVGASTMTWLLMMVALTFPQFGNAMVAPKRVVAMGTSLTARGGWVPALEAELTRCFATPVVVEAVAKSGASSAWGLTVVDMALRRAPDIVLVEFASNDAALNRFMSPRTSAANLASILTGLTNGKGRPRIIVMAMNPVWGLRGLLRPQLSRYIARSQQVAQEAGAEFLDFRPAWARLSSEDLRRAIPDGLHPDPDVAIRVMIPELTKRIAGSSCPNDADLR